MNIDSAFPSTYIKAADLQNRNVNVMISHVSMEEVGGDTKPVIYFLNKERGMVLNKTNANIIAEMYGKDTDAWHGKAITIYPARVEFAGKIVDGIRVKLDAMSAPQTQVAAPAQQQAPQQAAPVNSPVGTISDEIPF